MEQHVARFRWHLATIFSSTRDLTIRFYRQNLRWRARVFLTRADAMFGILFDEFRSLFSKSKQLSVTWPPDRQHGLGEVFAMLVCIRQLSELGWGINLELRRPTNANPSFEGCSEGELDEWFLAARVMTEGMLVGLGGVKVQYTDELKKSRPKSVASPLEKILSSSWGLSPLSTVLFRYSQRKKKGEASVRLNHLGFSKRELVELGLPEFFVSWNVRQNPLYRLSSNPSAEEITADFLALCRAQPLPIVLLTEARERSKVEQILASSPDTSELALQRLVSARSINFWEVLRTVWSSQAYFQRRGGGAGMAAIYSSVPYVILFPNRDLMGRFHIGRKGRLTPWALHGRQIGSVAEPSAHQFNSVYCRLNDLDGS